jgi:YebC/PmpR family DNA-binding regulatory protein
MSGHSKWSTIKRKKAATDARRAKLWTKLLREITVAARLGSGDPDADPRLRSAVADARAANVPGDNIDRAILKGTGELEGSSYEEVSYEGYGPGGVAILVEAMTDNRNRTVAELRHLFTRQGGSLAESGAVAWMFERQGIIALSREALSEEAFIELAVELGVQDLSTAGEHYELYTGPGTYHQVLETLEARGIQPVEKELAMTPQSTVEPDREQALKSLRLLEALEDHDDVQNVWANLEIDDEVLAAAE